MPLLSADIPRPYNVSKVSPMTDESSIFDAEPENLDRLFSQILGAPQEQEESGPAATVEGPIEQPGSRIGRYKLLSVLGVSATSP